MPTTHRADEPPEIGVVIPFYRADRSFPATLASVLAQSRQPAAIVVVDDASPEGESSTLDSLPAGIQLVRLRSNVGIGAARQEGMAHLTTPFVAFLDADDRWSPDFLEVMSSRLEADESLPAVYAGITRCWPDGRRESFRDKPIRLELGESIIRSHTIPSAMLFRREAVEAVGGWPRGRMLVEDWIMTVRLIDVAGPLGFVPETSIDYTVGNPASANSQDLHTLRRWWHTTRVMRTIIEATFGPGAARRRFAQAIADRADRRRGASRRILHLASRLLGPPLRDG